MAKQGSGIWGVLGDVMGLAKFLVGLFWAMFGFSFLFVLMWMVQGHKWSHDWQIYGLNVASFWGGLIKWWFTLFAA